MLIEVYSTPIGTEFQDCRNQCGKEEIKKRARASSTTRVEPFYLAEIVVIDDSNI